MHPVCAFPVQLTWLHRHWYHVFQKMRLDRDISSIFTHLIFCFIAVKCFHRCPGCHRSLAGTVSRGHVTGIRITLLLAGLLTACSSFLLKTLPGLSFGPSLVVWPFSWQLGEMEPSVCRTFTADRAGPAVCLSGCSQCSHRSTGLPQPSGSCHTCFLGRCFSLAP